MKKITSLLAIIALFSFSAIAQTGQGVTLQLSSPTSFNPTNVDSTSYLELIFTNSVNSQQIVTFSNLSLPFDLQNSLTIDALDSDTIQMSFTPTSTGTFSDTLIWSCNVFGSGLFEVNGEGVQVILSTSTDSLDLGTISVGTNVTDSFMISNTGTGTMHVSNISSSNSYFSVNPSSGFISQGSSMYVTVTFSPLMSGLSTSTLSIQSNDPNSPVYNVNLQGTGVSELSGFICNDTLLLANSPFTLIGDLIVNDSCSLLIEAGVVIDGGGYDFVKMGDLSAIGTMSDSIILYNFNAVYFTNSNTSDTLNYLRIGKNTSEYDSLDVDKFIYSQKEESYLSNSRVNSEEFTSNTLRSYNFDDNIFPTKWYRNSTYINATSERLYFDAGSNWSTYFCETEEYLCLSSTVDVEFYLYFNGSSSSNFKLYYRLNSGGWTVLNSWSNYHDSQQSQSINVTPGDIIEFKFEKYRYYYYSGNGWIDNFNVSNGISTNTYNKVTVNNSELFANIISDTSIVLNNTNIKSHNTGILINNGDLSLNNCVLEGDDGNGISSYGDSTNIILNNTTINGFEGYGIWSQSSNSIISLNNSSINGSASNEDGIWSNGSNMEISLYDSEISDFNLNGIDANGSGAIINTQYSFIKNNQTGIYVSSWDSEVNVSSSMISDNNTYGIYTGGRVNSSYSNITFNNSDGIYLTGNNFSDLKNSIIWGNNTSTYRQIYTGGGITSITYSTVQGLNAYGTTSSGSGQYYYGDGSIDDDPVFADPEQHMSPFSNCVDAGTPWEVDANMPYGLGGVRADIGIYGGPDNWFWGGTPVPDGSPVVTSIEDSPQDQGGSVGVLFDASVWDNSTLLNNVTSYSIWRNFDVSGASIDSVDQGNWQLMGYVPAQSFSAYAFEAATLGDSSIANGMFNNCYVVVAHTSDSSTFWYSNVLCGYSVDNLAPSAPIVSSMVDSSTQDVIVYWDAPQVSDYSSSTVFSLAGFSISGVTDTLAFDSSPVAGSTYTYGVVHYDVNGNGSDTSWTTITIDDDVDVIPLNAGWNLISTNHIPNNNNMVDIFSSLLPNNLVYVTSFNQGSFMYNPNGPSFLNTLNQFTDGYAYWVKVTNDDTLTITGNVIDPNYKIPLNAGWNLSGYMNTISQSPNQYLGDLISNNNLVYCTSFNQGTTLFNPNGLPFLNTLNSMQRPFGYWIKVNNPVNSTQYKLSDNNGNLYSPYFMFVNGKSNLENYRGEFIDVLNLDGEILNRIEILKDGYLMTTPLYGDDPSTDISEGFNNNENIIFSFNGQEIVSSFNFNGNMELKELDLNYTNFGSFNIFPNPSNGITNINFFTSKESLVQLHVYDVTGRLVQEVENKLFDRGSYTTTLDATSFDRGVYLIKLIVDGAVMSSERLILQ